MLTLATTSCGEASDVEVHRGVSAKFRPGQVWTYRHRPEERRSRLVVLRVDSTAKLGNIVHVRIEGLRIRNRLAPEPINHIAHIPFSEQALQRSASQLVGEQARLPDYSAGYAQWLEGATGEGVGVFTIDVADAVEVIEETTR
jgi:hypothetical protein